jgi:hypothetical protein
VRTIPRSQRNVSPTLLARTLMFKPRLGISRPRAKARVQALSLRVSPLIPGISAPAHLSIHSLVSIFDFHAHCLSNKYSKYSIEHIHWLPDDPDHSNASSHLGRGGHLFRLGHDHQIRFHHRSYRPGWGLDGRTRFGPGEECSDGTVGCVWNDVWAGCCRRSRGSCTVIERFMGFYVCVHF